MGVMQLKWLSRAAEAQVSAVRRPFQPSVPDFWVIGHVRRLVAKNTSNQNSLALQYDPVSSCLLVATAERQLRSPVLSLATLSPSYFCESCASAAGRISVRVVEPTTESRFFVGKTEVSKRHANPAGQTGEGLGWRWLEDELQPDGTIERIHKSEVLGSLKDFPTKRLAQRELDGRVSVVNSPTYRARPTATFNDLAEKWKMLVMVNHADSIAKKREIRHQSVGQGYWWSSSSEY